MQRKSNYLKSQRHLYGFTLVELLVVISIIAVLLSIMMPALKKAREQAKSVKCLFNERQLGLALQFYLQDYNKYLPGIDNPGIWIADKIYGKTWVNMYVGSILNAERGNAFLTCPAYRAMWFGQGNYGMNYDVCAFDYWRMPFRKIEEIKSPGKCLFICDVFYEGPNYASAQQYMTGHMDFKGKEMGRSNQHFRHSGKLNILYVDGHVGSRRDPLSPDDYLLWNWRK